jgi:hypothetical protein
MIMTEPTKKVPICTDVTVVIRSVGERTLELCRQLVCKQVPVENVFVINQYPFQKAAQRSCEIGIELGKPWTLCLDADILLRRNAVQTLRKWALAAGERALYVQGSILDKIFGGPRQAGPSLHRTSLLPIKLKYLPTEGLSLRPETDAAMKLAALGYPHPRYHMIVAVHDFEQYYRDIYRKAFIHAFKHAEHITTLELLWQRLAAQDPDYEVCLWGLRDARVFKGVVSLDVRRFPKELDDICGLQQFQEKKALCAEMFANFDIDNMIVEYGRHRLMAK